MFVILEITNNLTAVFQHDFYGRRVAFQREKLDYP